MTQLLVIRETIQSFIGKYENYFRPASKFALCLISLLMINGSIGYTEKITGLAVVLIVSLLCSFLPINTIVVASALFVLLHLYTLSLESVIVVGALMMLMFLLYFRFTPKDTILLLLTPLCFVLKIPYVIPLAAGLVAAPSAVISVGCGVVMYYMLSYISANTVVLAGGVSGEMLAKIKFLIDELLFNREMLMVVISFAITIITVNIIRRLSVDYAWDIAIVTGALMNILIILIGDLKFGTYISIVGLIFGSIVGVAIVIVLKFFAFNVDYSRTEHVQFEDDEYYYYVKAVPKNTLSLADKKIKKIKGQSGQKPQSSVKREGSGRIPAEGKDATEYRVRRSATRENERSNSSGNKSGTKRIILPDEDLNAINVSAGVREEAASRRQDRNGMTSIERAAAAKARSEREERNRRQ